MKQDNNILVKQGLVYNAVDREPAVRDILVKNGKILKIAEKIDSNEIGEVKVLDVTGMRVYPGFVEAHCHIGLDGYAVGFEGNDYNEATDSVTPQLRGIDGINPLDHAFYLAREGGVTTICTGPGSANVVGGTFTAIKTYGKRVDDMTIQKEVAMKCAFGENPKRVYKDKDNMSRMATASKLRVLLAKTKEYDEKLTAAIEDPSKKPAFDAKLEAMLPVIRKEMPLKAHAHRADDIFTAIRIAKEFDVKLTLEHVTDGSLIAEELAKDGYPCAVGPSFGHPGKIELENKSYETPGILAKAGCQVSIITDAGVIPIQNLPLCAGLAVREGMDQFEALKAITIHPAMHIGVADRVGSIEIGKDADFVITKADPMLSDTRVLYTIIDGTICFQYQK